MSTEKLNLPNEALTPGMHAAMNAAIASAVKEVFAQMSPLISAVSLTPEKLAAAEALRRAPDPAKVAREMREKQLMREDLEEAARQKEKTQNACSHKDSNLRWSCSVVHNFLDRQPRIICLHCHTFFEPDHWEIGNPDAQNPRGKPFIKKAHPRYREILQDISAQQQTV